MRYRTKDKKIIVEDTGVIKVHNFPPNYKTYSYITRVYRKYEHDKFGYVEEDGDPIYFDDLTEELRTLAIIIGNAQNALNNKLPHHPELIPLK